MRRALLLACIGCAAVVGCSGAKPEKKSEPAPQPGMVAGLSKMGQLATDPFTQMSLTFDGNPLPDEIHEKLDKVLGMWNVELTNANRGLAGKTLTTLRKEQGHAEMAILESMSHATPASGESFDDAVRRVSTSMN